jgi:HEPN domain-containing protein
LTEPLETVRESVRAWLTYAEDGLASVGRSLDPPPLIASALFHAQQAVEKALKGYLVALGHTSIPRTHNLVALAEMGRESGGICPPDNDLAFLGKFGSRVRYPEEPPHDLDEALKAQELATRLVSQMSQAIAELLGE